MHDFLQLRQIRSQWSNQWMWLRIYGEKKSIYKAVERHTSPSWYWAWVCDSQFLSWPLKLSLWNSLVMADRDFPLVSGRNRPTYRADNRQTAPKGTKQYSLNSLCGRKATKSCKTYVRCDTNDEWLMKCLIVCIHLQIKICFTSQTWINIQRAPIALLEFFKH